LSSADTVYRLTNDTAVLVNGWQPHSYVHDPGRPRTVILALYIEPEWLTVFRPGWVASGAPGFFFAIPRRRLPAHPWPRHDLAADMMAYPEARMPHESALSDLMIAVIERFTHGEVFRLRSGISVRSVIGASVGSLFDAIRNARGAALVSLPRKRDCRGRISSDCSKSSIGVPRRFTSRCSHGGRRSTRFSISRRASANQQPAWLYGAGALHALLPQPRRRKSSRVRNVSRLAS